MYTKNKSLKKSIVLIAMFFIVAALAVSLVLPALKSTTVFGAVIGSYNLDQGKNGGVDAPIISPVEWVNGNLGKSKAHYTEGDSAPYRVILTDLPTDPADPTTIRIEWDIRKGGTNAIDYITGPQRIAEEVDPTTGIDGLGAVSYWEIPAPTTSDDPAASGKRYDSFDALPDDHDNIYLWAYNVDNVTFGSYVNGSDLASDSSTYIDIMFWPTSSTVVLAWGGHIASEGDWGTGNSAISISGSPYHMRILHMSNSGGTGGGNQDMSLSASAVTPEIGEWEISKTATSIDTAGDGIINNAGEIIGYTVEVENTGNTTITGVGVSDSLITLTRQADDPGNDDSNLDPGETWVYTGSYTVLQADINSNGGGDGDIDNTATASCAELDDISDSAAVPLIQNASYTITKTATSIDTAGNGIIDNAGEIIGYTVEVENTGNQTITGVGVSDSLITLTRQADDPGNDDSNLDLGETWVYTGSYTVLQADIDSNGGGDGDIDNTATVSSNELADESDNEEVPIAQNASYTITKTATSIDTAGNGIIDNAGEIIGYTVEVENTGNTTITGVGVSDSLITLTRQADDPGNDDGNLDPGETWVYTGSYTVLQADINSNGGGDGDIDNTATVSSNELDDESDNEEVPLTQNPSLTITKDADLSTVSSAGEIITYTIIVDNTGNVDLTGVVLTDPFAGGAILTLGDDNTNGILETTETWFYEAMYTVTEPDIIAGTDLVNTAYVDTDQTDQQQDDATTIVIRTGSVEITKLTNGVVDETQEWIFRIYEGTYPAGTYTELNTLGVGTLEASGLDITKTYIVVELDVPVGWTSSWYVGATQVFPFNPDGTDVGNRAIEIGDGTPYPIPPNGTLVVEVNNAQGDGEARTPGYWKNWNRVTGGRQAETADRNGGWEEGFWLVEDVLAQSGGSIDWDDILTDGFVFHINTSEKAVRILDKRSDTGDKMARDAAYNLACNLLAYQMNLVAGAYAPPQVVIDAAADAEELLDEYDFDGTGEYLRPWNGEDYHNARVWAGILDAYNNNVYYTP